VTNIDGKFTGKGRFNDFNRATALSYNRNMDSHQAELPGNAR
jgi:hypothetical protein